MDGFKEKVIGGASFLIFADGAVAVSDVSAFRKGKSALEPFEEGVAVLLKPSGEWVQFEPLVHS